MATHGARQAAARARRTAVSAGIPIPRRRSPRRVCRTGRHRGRGSPSWSPRARS